MTAHNIFKKRFIAGAVCPECQAVDRIVVETAMPVPAGKAADRIDPEQALSRRRCVACGFADEFSAANLINSQGVPRGKPEKPRPRTDPSTTLTQAVRILVPGKPPQD
ncbi:MAG: YheV family putative metal-binding protein [bacterium]